MAEGVLFDLAGSLIEMLGSAAFEEARLLYGVKDEFQKLVGTIEVIKGVLLDAEEKMVVDNQVKAWLKRLGDIFIVADDLVDKHTTNYSASKTTSKRVICEGKHNLQSLTLNWNLGDDNNNNMVENDEMSIEGLQPPSNLKVLHVWGFMGVRFGEYMCSSAEDDDFDANLFFPSLVTLQIEYCFNLKWWWWKKEVDGNNIRSFPRLSNLVITDCPNLTSMPLFPTIAKVELRTSSSMALEDTFKMLRGSKAHNTHPNISLLSSIQIIYCEDLTSIMGIDNLPSLVSITIQYCPNLTTLLEGIDNLPALKDIDIKLCHNLTSVLEGVDTLPSLTSICIEQCRNLTSVLEGIDNLPSLESVNIFNCPSLTSVLEGIDNLPSLKSIYIRDCPNLTSFPGNFRKMWGSIEQQDQRRVQTLDGAGNEAVDEKIGAVKNFRGMIQFEEAVDEKIGGVKNFKGM
ncbi:hypothetical protein G4B88_020359, partial [Cannabis sativa]